MLDKEYVFDVMKERGYGSPLSTFESKGEIIAYNFIKRITSEVTIHAKVTLKSNSISLSFVELRYFCQLLADGFAFDHKDFEKYEQIICMYAATCINLDVLKILDDLKKTVEPPKEKKPVKELSVRKRELWDQIAVVGKTKNYQKDMCLEFYNYWTEMNPAGKKMRFEMEKIFDIGRRLVTWGKNDIRWSKTFIDKKVEEQDKQKESTKINKNDIF